MNCPRPSYWAFQMASDALRGKLLKTVITGDKESLITTYYTENGKKKSLLVINKSSEKLKEGWANDPSKKAKKGVDVSKPIKVGKRTITLITIE